MAKFAVNTLIVLFACAQLGTYAVCAQSETDTTIVQRLDEIAMSIAQTDSNLKAIETRLKEFTQDNQSDGGLSNLTLTIVLVVLVGILFVIPWIRPYKITEPVEKIAGYLEHANFKEVASRLENAKFETRLEPIATIGQDVKRIADLLEKDLRPVEEIAGYFKDANFKEVASRLENAKFETRLEPIATIGQDVKRIADLLEKDLRDERSKKIDERLEEIDKRLTEIEETPSGGHR